MTRTAALACLVALGALAGCSEDVPAAGGLTESYTLWGALDPTSDTQRLRVVRITPTITSGSSDPLPATVTSTDAATGAVTTWRDSVVTFGDGTIGHVFVAAFRPAFGSVHVVRVTDPERPEVSALVRVPAAIPAPVLLPTTRQQNAPIYTGFWPDAPRLNRARVRYTILSRDCAVHVVEREVRPAESVPVEFGWEVRVPMQTEAPEIVGALPPPSPYALVEIAMTGEVASEDWRPPGGVFDPEVLIDPTVFGNVSGGFGFVGAAYGTALVWQPSPDDLSGTPFRVRFTDC